MVVAQEIIDTMVPRIVEQFQPVRVILFGSHARDRAGPWSDVDLMVVVRDCADRRALTVAIDDALTDLPVFKDILVATEAELPELRSQTDLMFSDALEEGRVLHEHREA